jgi:hypothetical protein
VDVIHTLAMITKPLNSWEAAAVSMFWCRVSKWAHNQNFVEGWNSSKWYVKSLPTSQRTYFVSITKSITYRRWRKQHSVWQITSVQWNTLTSNYSKMTLTTVAELFRSFTQSLLAKADTSHSIGHYHLLPFHTSLNSLFTGDPTIKCVSMTAMLNNQQIISSHLRLGLHSELFHSQFTTKTFKNF